MRRPAKGAGQTRPLVVIVAVLAACSSGPKKPERNQDWPKTGEVAYRSIDPDVQKGQMQAERYCNGYGMSAMQVPAEVGVWFVCQ